MKLNTLQDKPGARHARTRVGRGVGSGSGKTGGRGMKGQKSRTGVAIKGFEGGQMPIHRRLPKRGFTPPSRKQYGTFNLTALQQAVDAGKLDPKQPINGDMLIEAGVTRRAKDGVKLLGSGALKAALKLDIAKATASAVAAVEKAGGSLTQTAKATPSKTA